MNTGAESLRPPGARRGPLVVAVLLLPVVVLAAILCGVESVPLADALRIILAELGFHTTADPESPEYVIISVLRMPRVAVLALAGAGLAAAGAALQATFQNPLAEPGLLGISSGATLGTVLAFFVGWGDTLFLSVPACAFVGAIAAGLLVYFLAHAGGRPSTTSLLLTGVAVGALMSAGTVLIQTWVEDYHLKKLLFWMVGGAQNRTWIHALAAAPPIVLGGVGILALHRRMDALSLGEEHALSVGVSVHRTRMLLLLVSALVAAAAVSVCGPIGFVGLIVPHVGRLIVGPRAKLLVPMSVVGGAMFLVLCDLFARMLTGTGEVVHLGVITAFLGVPFFLWLLARSKRFA